MHKQTNLKLAFSTKISEKIYTSLIYLLLTFLRFYNQIFYKFFLLKKIPPIC